MNGKYKKRINSLIGFSITMSILIIGFVAFYYVMTPTINTEIPNETNNNHTIIENDTNETEDNNNNDIDNIINNTGDYSFREVRKKVLSNIISIKPLFNISDCYINASLDNNWYTGYIFLMRRFSGGFEPLYVSFDFNYDTEEFIPEKAGVINYVKD